MRLIAATKLAKAAFAHCVYTSGNKLGQNINEPTRERHMVSHIELEIKLVHISLHTRSLRVHRTGVVSQRLVLRVVHTQQLVVETCCCDLSPSHLCPGLHANAKIANFPFFAKIATLVGDLCSLPFQCSAIFAILTVFAKIVNFAKNRKNRGTLKSLEH